MVNCDDNVIFKSKFSTKVILCVGRDTQRDQGDAWSKLGKMHLTRQWKMALDLEWLGHEVWVLIWESVSHERRGVGWHRKLYNEYNGSSSMATILFKISLQWFLHFWFLWFWPNMCKKRKAKRQGLYKVNQENEIRNHILPLDLEL